MNAFSHRIFLSPLPILLLFLPGCTQSSPWGGSVGTEDGIESIFNPGTPLLGDDDVVVSTLWDVREGSWVDPTRVHAGAESITVVDPPANQIHLASLNGEAGRSLGRPGGGPGEFLRLLDAIPEGDSLVVLDAGKGSVQYLTRDGRYLSSLHLDGQPWAGFRMEDGTLLVKGEFLSDPTEESFGDWVRVGEGSEPVAFTDVALDPLPEERGAVCSDLSPWFAGAARLRFTKPEIQMFDRSGSLMTRIRIDLPVEEVTEEERRTALDELERRLETRGVPAPFIEQSLVTMEERWRVKCRLGPLRIDRTKKFAAFLEQNPDDFGSGSATLHFLSEEGVYLARIAFPTPWRDFAMADGVVYALTREPDTDLISLEAFRIDLPESVFDEAADVLEEARKSGANGS